MAVADATLTVVEPWRQDAAEVAAALGSHPAQGLTAAEATARLARDGPNRLDATEEVPRWPRFVVQIVDPLVYLLIAAIVVSLIAWALEGADGVPFDALVIGVII